MPAVTSTPTLTPTAPHTPAYSTHLRVWLDDRLVDPAAARIPALDHGLVVGDGVFEALKVGPAGPFTVSRHLDRLTRSARALGLPEPDHGLLREAIAAVTADRSYEHGKVRITYTGGVGPLGSQPAYGPPTVVVAADERKLSDPETAVVTAPWRRNEHGALTGVKSTSYAENVRALAYAFDRGASEAILANTAGHLCEGTGANIFVVVRGRAVTPPLSAGPLAGITRDLVLEWAEAGGIRIDERDLTLAEAQAADEVFLTSSMRDVQPVTRWDERTYAVGPVTWRLAALFAERSAADLDG